LWIAIMAVIVIAFPCSCCDDDDALDDVFHVDGAGFWGTVGHDAPSGLWYIEVDLTKHSYFFPTNLPDSFKVEGIAIRFTGRFSRIDNPTANTDLSTCYKVNIKSVWLRQGEYESEDAVSYSFYINAEEALVPLEELPSFIQERVAVLSEFIYFYVGIGKVFRGEWNDRVVYAIYCTGSNHLKDIYYEDGSRIDFAKEDFKKFMTESQGWRCLYVIFDYTHGI